MSGKRKAVGPVRKELQGFRVLHQSLEAERCNSLLSDDPTVSSPGSLVCRPASVVSKSSSRSSRGLIVGGVGGGPPWSTVAAPSTQRPTRRLNLVQTVSRTPPGSAFGRGGDGRGYKGTGKGTQRHKDLTPKAEDQRPTTEG